MVIYIVNLQSSFDPIAKSISDNLGFDYATFVHEASRLKLPNQEMTISIQIVDKDTLQSETGIGLGLSSCRREGVVPGGRKKSPENGPPKEGQQKKNKTEFYQYYDAACLWAHIHPTDSKDQNVLKNKFKKDQKVSSTKVLDVVSICFCFFCMLIYHSRLFFRSFIIP
jgi:hypothetical protein